MRKTALLILNEYEKENTYLNLALKEMLSPNTEGRAFVTELVYGVVRYRRFLDEKISRYSSVKVKKLSIPVKNILRMAFYQIYFMEKVPDFAIINESVKLTAKYAYKSKGFVNAVLRKGIEKTEEELPIAVRESFPDALYELFVRQYGDETDGILSALNHKPKTTLRYHHMRFPDAKTAAIHLKGATVFGDAIIPGETGSLLPCIQNGDFSVQSISSQLAVNVLAPQPGERVLDACSAPGGKTVFIGELMQNKGEIVACELHAHRCELVRKNLERSGITIAEVLQADATQLQFTEKFDRVLADVPCSGLGVIGSKPDIKWREFDFRALTEIQHCILNCVKNFVKPGGTLIYSTCTINRGENEEQINRFLTENPEFSLEAFSVEIGGKLYGEKGMAQILPNEATIGFFIAKLRKADE